MRQHLLGRTQTQPFFHRSFFTAKYLFLQTSLYCSTMKPLPPEETFRRSVVLLFSNNLPLVTYSYKSKSLQAFCPCENVYLASELEYSISRPALNLQKGKVFCSMSCQMMSTRNENRQTLLVWSTIAQNSIQTKILTIIYLSHTLHYYQHHKQWGGKAVSLYHKVLLHDAKINVSFIL